MPDFKDLPLWAQIVVILVSSLVTLVSVAGTWWGIQKAKVEIENQKLDIAAKKNALASAITNAGADPSVINAVEDFARPLERNNLSNNLIVRFVLVSVILLIMGSLESLIVGGLSGVQTGLFFLSSGTMGEAPLHVNQEEVQRVAWLTATIMTGVQFAFSCVALGVVLAFAFPLYKDARAFLRAR